MGRKTDKKHYEQENVDFVVKLVDEGVSARKATREMCKHFGLECDEVVERAFRQRIANLNKSKAPNTLENSDEFKKAREKQFDTTKKRFIISWAQADTKIHEQFLENIEAYAEDIDAEILIIAGRYKSPTSLEASKAQEKKDKNKNFWDVNVTKYLTATRQNLHEYLSVLAELKIQPTASTPLSGLNGMSGLESCIIGSPSVHLKSLPVLPNYPKKLLLTTGAVTLPNYTDTKAGKKGEFHHQLGFVIVELDEDIFHMRQVQCDDNGTFYDLIYKVKNGVVSVYHKQCPAIVFGDLHLGEEDSEVVEAAFSLVDRIGAEKIILHDVFSGYSVSHHELNNPFILAQRELDNSWKLAEELDYMVQWFLDRPQYNFVSVASNHNTFIDRWLMSNDWRKSPNKNKYLELAYTVSQGKAPKGIIPYLLDNNTSNVISLSYDDSFRVKSWELGIHGCHGTNGSRGSISQYKNLNTKTIVAHSHTPARELGSVQVGTFTKLKLNYVSGLSSWLASMAIVYPNEKVSQIHILNGKFTTLF